MKDVIEWLLEGEPFVEYRTRVDLLDQSEDELKDSIATKRVEKLARNSLEQSQKRQSTLPQTIFHCRYWIKKG